MAPRLGSSNGTHTSCARSPHPWIQHPGLNMFRNCASKALATELFTPPDKPTGNADRRQKEPDSAHNQLVNEAPAFGTSFQDFALEARRTSRRRRDAGESMPCDDHPLTNWPRCNSSRASLRSTHWRTARLRVVAEWL